MKFRRLKMIRTLKRESETRHQTWKKWRKKWIEYVKDVVQKGDDWFNNVK